jgi:hypothetical protein
MGHTKDNHEVAGHLLRICQLLSNITVNLYLTLPLSKIRLALLKWKPKQAAGQQLLVCVLSCI